MVFVLMSEFGKWKSQNAEIFNIGEFESLETVRRLTSLFVDYCASIKIRDRIRQIWLFYSNMLLLLREIWHLCQGFKSERESTGLSNLTGDFAKIRFQFISWKMNISMTRIKIISSIFLRSKQGNQKRRTLGILFSY